MKYLSFLFLLSTLNCWADSLVYMREDSAGKHIYRQDEQGTRKLTNGNDWHIYPDISSDGKEVAYIRVQDGNFSVEVYREASAQLEVWLFTDVKEIFHLNYSHNNQYLLLSAKTEGQQKLAYLDLKAERAQKAKSIHTDNQGLRVLTYEVGGLKTFNRNHDVFFPRTSSDRSFYVFQENTPQGKDIVFYDRLTQKEFIVDQGMAPALSYDERFIAYTKKFESEWDLMVYDRFTKEKIRLKHTGARDFAPSFDRHNNLLFASDILGQFNLYTLEKKLWARGKFALRNLIKVQEASDNYAPQMSGDEKYLISKLKDFPAPARSSFGAIYHEGRVYISGGHQGPEHTYPESSFTNTFQYYDLVEDVWVQAAPRFFKCHGYGLIAHENFIYAFGGFAYSKDHTPHWKSLNVVERYNIKKNIWEIIGEMPRGRSSNVVVKVTEKVYLIGGWDSTPKHQDDLEGTFHSETDIFDLVTETFSTLEHKLTPKRRAFSAVTHQDKIYLIGGISEGSSHFSLLNNVTEFDPKTGQFTERAPLPFATFAPAAGMIDNQLYVFGGMFKTGEWDYEYVGHIFQSDFDSWQHTGRYLTEAKGFSQVLSIENRLMILGGHHYLEDRDEPVRSVELFEKK